MRWMGLSLLLALCSGEALAQACVVHSTGARIDVKVCQQNRNIPEKLFAEGFCQPNLPGQKVEVQTPNALLGHWSTYCTSTNAPAMRSAFAATPKSPICLTVRIFTITAWPPMRRI